MKYRHGCEVGWEPAPWMALVIDDSPDNPSNQCILGLLDRTQCLTFI